MTGAETTSTEYKASLSPKGKALYQAFLPLLNRLDLNFPMGDDEVPSTSMALADHYKYNAQIRDFIASNEETRKLFLSIVFKMRPAVAQMASYLYPDRRKTNSCPDPDVY